jgi:hypothetical protein
MTPRMFRFSFGASGSDHEVRPAQEIEVQDVVVDDVAVVDQLTELARGLGRLDAEGLIERLDRGEVVCDRAYSTDSAGKLRHVLGFPANAELLEPAQFRHLQIGVLDLALVIEENLVPRCFMWVS